MDRQTQIIAIGLIGLAVIAGGWIGIGSSEPVAPPPELVFPEPEGRQQSRIVVHVAGWVVKPGVVTLTEGARVADAVAAAGGIRPGARLEAINLAASLLDGQQVLVPGPGDDAVASGTEDGRLRLNQASAVELEALPGVGPVLAERIVAYRETHGPFSQPEDLLGVPGIGERKLQSLRDYLIVP